MNKNFTASYGEMIAEADAEIKKYNSLLNIYSFLRLFVLIAGGFVIWQTMKFEKALLTELCILLVIILFAWLVKKQSDFSSIKEFFTALKKVSENELNIIRQGDNFYDNGLAFKDDRHDYTSDLDIFGHASLFHLMNRCATSDGNRMLAGWLSNNAETALIRNRQQAVKEFSSKVRWKMEFQARLLFARQDKSENTAGSLIKYLDMVQTAGNTFVFAYVRYIPWIVLPLAILAWFYHPVLILLLLAAITNSILVFSRQTEISRTEQLIGKAGSTISKYSEVFDMLEKEQFESPLCQMLCNKLKDERGVSLSASMKRLSVLLNRLEYRLNMFVGPLLNIFFAWDLRQLYALEKWKDESRAVISGAFDTLAAVEALESLASMCINNPAWCFPEIADDENYTYVIRQGGHPLIVPEVRVTNDFFLENELKADIVTGSNMAGKSTFLRTLGINAVLALCGAPVCATDMRITNMRIFTYMRIRDSLNENISTFKAELNRLQQLLAVLNKEGKVYFLIDEMLRGTNSTDKYLGSKAVIEKLIAMRAVGVLATHDLKIAELEQKYPDYIRNFYFDIQVDGNDMHFDYKLKKGECTTFNASLLLRQLGIEISGD